MIGFLGLRAIRIYPALFVEVGLSAFGLGLIFTTASWGAYFSSHDFYRYLINVTGHISYYLPGVFDTNPNPRIVNGQLWTVPFELYCYLSLTLLMLVGLTRKPVAFAIGVALLQIVHFGLFARIGHAWLYQSRPGHLDGMQLVFSFLCGVAFYLLKDRVPWNRSWGIASLVATLVLLSIPLGEYLAVFTAAYLTAYVGLLNPRKISILRGADYSYGIYLYGWPIQQSLIATSDWARIWWLNIIAALICSAAFAAFSWHCIEKPALRLRAPLKRVEAAWLAFRASLSIRPNQTVSENA